MSNAVILGSPECRQATEQARTEMPSVYEYLYPRNYSCPDTHISPRFMTAVGAGLLYEQRQGQASPTFASAYVAVAAFGSAGAQTFFVDRLFLDGVQKTTLPPLTLAQIPWPFASILFVLPRDAISIVGRPVAWIQVTHLTGGKGYAIPGGTPEMYPEDLAVTTTYIVDGRTYTTAASINDEPVSIFADQTEFTGKCEGWGPCRWDEPSASSAAAALGIKLLLALSARPDLAATETIVQAARPARNGPLAPPAKRDLWQPRWLGRGWRPVGHQEPLGGHHASPRMHWRRGHFRILVAGEGKRWMANRTIWLEPTLVAAEAAAPAAVAA